MKTACALVLCLLALAPVAYAEPIPAYMLDKDFTSCMGGENPQQATERRDYCLCIRNSMKDWTLEAYGKMALEESKAHDAAQMPVQLQNIAKACITKVMGPPPG